MKILLPRSQKAREVLYRELNALVPEELRPRHKVVVAKGRFGYYARIVKTGPLTPAELSERRRQRKRVAESPEPSGRSAIASEAPVCSMRLCAGS
jgi:hypothetical protein